MPETSAKAVQYVVGMLLFASQTYAVDDGLGGRSAHHRHKTRRGREFIRAPGTWNETCTSPAILLRKEGNSWRSFSTRGYSGKDVDTVVQRLEAMKAMVAVDGRVLSLAVREPFCEIPENSEYPGGTIDESLHPAMHGAAASRW